MSDVTLIVTRNRLIGTMPRSRSGTVDAVAVNATSGRSGSLAADAIAGGALF